MSAERPASRLRSVLRLAKRNEEDALRVSADGERRLASADREAGEARARVDELAGVAPTTPGDLRRHQQRAALRAAQARSASTDLEDRLADQLAARAELLGAVRRRRSLEELEARRLATQAGLVAHAAQRALDEIGQARRHRREQS